MKNEYRNKSVSIQLRAFELDLRGLTLDEIAVELSQEFDVMILDDKYVKHLVDAETVLYMLASNSRPKLGNGKVIKK